MDLRTKLTMCAAHQMGNRGPGPSCRLTFGAYDPVNFNNVPAP